MLVALARGGFELGLLARCCEMLVQEVAWGVDGLLLVWKILYCYRLLLIYNKTFYYYRLDCQIRRIGW